MAAIEEEFETLPDLRTAAKYFVNILLKYDAVTTHIISGTKGPIAYRISDLRIGKEDRIYYVCYNRTHLHTMGRLFGIKEELESEAQTVHMKILDFSKAHDSKHSEDKVFVVILMPDKTADTILVHRWLKYLQVYNTIREIGGEGGQLSASIPIRYMHQFEENERNGLGV